MQSPGDGAHAIQPRKVRGSIAAAAASPIERTANSRRSYISRMQSGGYQGGDHMVVLSVSLAFFARIFLAASTSAAIPIAVS